MQDLVLIGLAVVLFALSTAYVRGCERLVDPRGRDDSTAESR